MNCLPFLALAIATRWDHARDGYFQLSRMGRFPPWVPAYVSLCFHWCSWNIIESKMSSLWWSPGNNFSKVGKFYDFWRKTYPQKHTNLPELLKTLNKKTHPTYWICHKIYCTIYIRQEIPQRFHRLDPNKSLFPSPFLQLQTRSKKDANDTLNSPYRGPVFSPLRHQICSNLCTHQKSPNGFVCQSKNAALQLELWT